MNSKKIHFSEQSDAQLLARAAEIGVAQDHALLGNEIARFNKLFDELMSIKNELRARPGDRRRLIMELYKHRNMQVRLNSAKATLAIAPEEARALLEWIAASKHNPQAGDAGMCLWALDEGIFVPD
ncbi:DUF2019 domain-containing protein [Nitratireductor rhodophyticola]|uniref:DUF2019 domain-containing protein n=1 Tax=Nitratireductor rhodophyticola TaxID=2854036 RepID=UPI00300953D4